MKVYPSMLSANPCCLGDELRELAEADGIHWDVMDGNFVNSITFGAQIIKAHREITSQIFDVHLMVANPEKHIGFSGTAPLFYPTHVVYESDDYNKLTISIS